MPASKSTASLRKSKVATVPSNGSFTNADLLGYYRTMLLARHLDDQMLIMLRHDSFETVMSGEN